MGVTWVGKATGQVGFWGEPSEGGNGLPAVGYRLRGAITKVSPTPLMVEWPL